MKRFISVVMALLCVIALLPFSASAQEEYPEWECTIGTTVVPFSKGSQFIYEYTPTKDETIAFEFEYGAASVDLSYQSDASPSVYPKVVRVMKNDTMVYVLHLLAGQEYYINLYTFSCDKDLEVTTYEWYDSMYPTVQANETKSLTVSKDKSVSYITGIDESGIYTVSMGHKDLHCSVSGYPDQSANAYPAPIDLGYWYENGKCNYSYYLEAGREYCVELFYYEAGDLTTSFTLKKGDSSGDRDIWKAGDSKTLTIEPHDNENMKYKTFVFQAEKTGKYCIFSESFTGFIRGTNGEEVKGTAFQDPNLKQGFVYELRQGHYYTIDVHNYTTSVKTDTISLTYYTDYKSGELKILSHSPEMIKVGFFTDPVCAEYDGITWSCSDPSVFEIKEFGASAELYTKKTGTAQITAKVGSLTKTITVSTTYTPPALQEGKTEYISGTNLSGLCAYFTPSVSGTYKVNMSPAVPDDMARYSLSIRQPNDISIYDNYGFSEWADVDVELEAGVKYSIIFNGTPATVRFDLKSAATAPTDPTQPEGTQPGVNSTEPTDEPTEPSTAPEQDNTEPSVNEPTQDPTEPSVNEPTQDPTEPSVEATVPSQGNNDPEDKPDDPTKGNDDEEQNATSAPTGGNNVVTDAVTKEDVQEAIDEALKTDQTLHYTVSQEGDRTFQMEMDALNTVVDNGMALSANFICGTTVSLPADVLMQLGKNGQDGQVQLKVEPKAFSALNTQQTKAIEGLVHGKLLSIDLSVADQQIHQLGGTAQITISNPDPGKDWRVLYLAEDGSTEEMKVSCSDSTITFCTNHFSYFVLVHDMPTQSGDVGNGFGGAWLTILGVLLLLGGAGAVMIVLHKKGMLHFPAKK